MIAETASLVHVLAMALWFGGLFGYVFIVWPSVFRVAEPDFPTAHLARTGMAAGPRVYLAMATAVISFCFYAALTDNFLS